MTAVVTVKLLHIVLFYLVVDCNDSTQSLTSGKKFILAFLQNYDRSAVLTMHMVTHDRPTVVTVSIAQPAYTHSVAIAKNSTGMIVLNSTYMLLGNQMSRSTITVISSEEITLIALNGRSKTYDTFLTLPTTVLGTKYYIITYSVDSLYNMKQFAVVNSNEHVLITITVSGSVTFNGTQYNDKESFSFIMEPNEAVQFQSNTDLTGTKVSSSKPVAVFSGDQCITVPPSNCDHIGENLYPVDKWSDSFIIFPLMKKKKEDLITIIASEPDTTVQVHTETGDNRLLLQESAHINVTVTGGVTLKSDKPIMVIYFFTGGSNPIVSTFDPFLLTVIPSIFFSNYYVFVTMQRLFNYLLVVSPGHNVANIDLDGRLLSTYPFEILHFAGFTGIRIYLGETGGRHAISHPSVHFAIYIYGIGRAESYGYPMGNIQPPIKQEKWGSLTCLPEAAVYMLPSSVLTNAKLSINDVHLIDPTCHADQRDENWVIITAPFNSCGTTIINDTGKIAYFNIVYGTAPQTSIHRLQIKLNCEMLTVENITMAFVPRTLYASHLGHYNVSFTLFHSEAFNDPVRDFPYEVEMNKTLYVQMKAETSDKGVAIFTDNCVSVPSLNANIVAYTIIENGCARDVTLRSHQSSDTREQRFSFHVFKFHDYPKVYVLCEVMICHKNSLPNRCAQGCLPGKHKRALSARDDKVKSARLSQGPIIFRRDFEELIRLQVNSERKGNSSYAPILGVLSGGFLISVFGLMFQRRYYLQQFHGFRRIPSG
ncbi:IgGFc-binding protein-like isoform X2 [Hemiscyllium ocellatum]|uniref:IgGFc-binding protein-like isoform X2 n=1 Tax=Hemiscyllium ocellatum TaxID=170820 RepID=UPI00296616C4|nr:IgGFc-binding protein-like isoform X2 [Hemiscyllium ocellatum]